MDLRKVLLVSASYRIDKMSNGGAKTEAAYGSIFRNLYSVYTYIVLNALYALLTLHRINNSWI